MTREAAHRCVGHPKAAAVVARGWRVAAVTKLEYPAVVTVPALLSVAAVSRLLAERSLPAVIEHGRAAAAARARERELAGVIWAAGAMTTVVVAALGAVSFWVARAIDGLARELGDRLDRIDVRFDRIETTVLCDHGERLEVQT